MAGKEILADPYKVLNEVTDEFYSELRAIYKKQILPDKINVEYMHAAFKQAIEAGITLVHKIEKRWTKEKPSKEGWYWKRVQGVVNIVYVRRYCNQLCIMNWPISDNAEWVGPLEEPEECQK